MEIVAAVVAHYERVARVMAEHFAAMPLVAVYYPEGTAGPAEYVGQLRDEVPASIPTVDAVTSSGSHTYVACATNSIEWLAHRGAVELCSWSPVAGEPDQCAFARIRVHPNGRGGPTVATGLKLVRERLARDGLDGVALLNARGGALWVPLGDRPLYAAVDAWLRSVQADVLASHADTFSDAPVSERGARLYLGTTTNHVGRFSGLPYSATGEVAWPVLVPVAWDDLDRAVREPVTVAAFEAWWERSGDLFGTIAAPLHAQHLPPPREPLEHRERATMWAPELAAGESRGPNIRAAIAVLADGKARTADEIVAEAAKRGLLAATTPGHQLYVALIEYIARARGVGRVPQIVQDEQRRFRLNAPADDWPAPAQWTPRIAPHPQADALVAALRTAGTGTDPAAFQVAVCAAFAALGFLAEHVGGQAAPDGYLDAPLGPLAYRVMLECKTAGGGRGTVSDPDAAEAVKYRDAYGAQYAALVGPAYSSEATLASELQTHAVSAWTIDDLAELLAVGANAYEVRALFAPGFVGDRVAQVRWEREHGVAKRVAVICEALVRLGREAQEHARNDAVNAPLLTEDAAMMLVDGYLAGAGSPVSCSRDEVRAAFAWLTNPMLGAAIWVDQSCQAVIVLTS